MNTIPVTKIIRIKYCHLEKIVERVRELRDVQKSLAELGFNLISDDGFFVTYEHQDYKNENRNTIIYIGYGEDVRSILFTVLEPEGKIR